MKGDRFFKKFSLRWSIEGPLEGFLGLTKELIDHESKLNKFILSSLAVSLALIVFFFISLSVQTIQFYLGFADMLSLTILIYVLKLFGTIVLIALSMFILLIIFQSYRFLDVLYSRFEGLRELWKSSREEGEFEEDYSIEISHVDPYKSSRSFTEDVSLEIPQLRKQIGYASTLFLLVMILLSIDFSLHITFITSEFGFFLPKYGDFGLLWKSIEFVLIPLSVLGWLFTSYIKEFLEYFDIQTGIVESIGKNETPFIPEGKDELQRFERYLMKKDGRLIRSLKKSSTGIMEGTKIKGCSGDEYDFDISHISDSNLDYVLLIRSIESDDIDLEYCMKYRDQVKDVIRGLEKESGEKPKYLRAVLLTSEQSDKLVDLDEDLVEFVLSEPIELREGPGGGPMKSMIQIVIEEGETYSFFPFLPEAEIERRY